MMAIERAQIDSQVATAKQYPRELARFKQRAMQMATLDGETAESCVYCRPVGKENGKQKFAEGPSVRMAEIVATCYGNIRVAARIVEQTPRYVICEGACHDLETNFAAKAEVKESTVDRNNQPYSERQSALIAKVCLSKAMRDAIFRVVPRALMKPVLDECKKVINKQTATIEQRIQRVQSWVASLRIDEKRFFAAINVTGWTPTEFTADIFETITGLKTAISEGGDGNTIDDIFPPVEGANARPNAPAPTAMQQAAQQQPTNVVPLKEQPAAATAAPIAPAPAQELRKAPAAKAKKPSMVEKPLTEDEAAKLREQGIAAEAPKPAEDQAESPTTPAADEPDLAAMGLAPEPEPTQAEEPAAAAEEPAAAESTVPALPGPDFWTRRQDEKDEAMHARTIQGLTQLMGQDEVTPEQMVKFFVANKFGKEGQKMADLATQKLQSVGKNWKVLLSKIKA